MEASLSERLKLEFSFTSYFVRERDCRKSGRVAGLFSYIYNQTGWSKGRGAPPSVLGRFLALFLARLSFFCGPTYFPSRHTFGTFLGFRLSLRACFGNILGSASGLLLERIEVLAFVLLLL